MKEISRYLRNRRFRRRIKSHDKQKEARKSRLAAFLRNKDIRHRGKLIHNHNDALTAFSMGAKKPDGAIMTIKQADEELAPDYMIMTSILRYFPKYVNILENLSKILAHIQKKTIFASSNLTYRFIFDL